MSVLVDFGVEHLADIREKPFSRNPDFRAKALAGFCAEAGIEYGAWPRLGSTEGQRLHLETSGDLAWFMGTFRHYATTSLDAELAQLAAVASRKSVALLCYERCHDECHRSIIADLVAEQLDATITAIS
jgi:uncharacterized protein (DUF488 family)